MLKCIIIDDEPLAIETLSNLITKYCDQITIVGTAPNALLGIKGINKLDPDIVFLDIDMPGGTGFDLLEAIPHKNFTVIFTTASSDYAIKAIRVHAADYLLKPIDIDELIAAVEKTRATVLSKTTVAKNQIGLPTTNGLKIVNVDEIVRLEANDNYTCFYLYNQKSKIIVSKTLKEFEAQLSDDVFCRIHQSHLINLKFIDSYVKGRGGYVIMKDGTEIEVSVRKKDNFLSRIKIQ